MVLSVLSFGAAYGQEAQEGEDPQSAESEERRVRRLGDAAVVDPTQEWVPQFDVDAGVGDQLSAAAAALQEGRLLDPPQDNAWHYLEQAANLNPDHPEVAAGKARVIQGVSDRVRNLALRDDTQAARELLGRLEAIAADPSLVAELERLLAARDEVRTLLATADAQMEANQLVAPEGDNALATYRSVLGIDDANEPARTGIRRIAIRVAERAVERAVDDPLVAVDLLARASALVEENPTAESRSAMQQATEATADAVIARARETLTAGDADGLAALMPVLTQLTDAGDERIATLQDGLARLRWLEAHPPGTVFDDPLGDGSPGPEMVVIPAGTFTMGSPRREEGRRDSEGPQVEMTLRPFALGRTEVTVAQFGRFIEATGYRTDADGGAKSALFDEERGTLARNGGVTWRDGYNGSPADLNDPVMHVSWNDAQAFIDWLAKETGQRYRLPSEAEFEYALRAGSTGPYWWGRGVPDTEAENLAGAGDPSPGGWSWNGGFRRYNDGHWGAAPVASFETNPFGLYDMGGNLMEWTADCMTPLAEKPTDGRPAIADDCRTRVVKGGSWASVPERSRSAGRVAIPAGQPNGIVGFRVARDL